MEEKIAIIYAHRKRDVERIRLSFESLKKQSSKNFEVIFVDYGSNAPLTEDLKKLMGEYDFVSPFFLPVPQLLWNKSKALNYGVLQSKASYIFIADVDLIFPPKAIERLEQLKKPESFFLFKMGYLDQDTSSNLMELQGFDDLKASRVGEVNGMVLAPRGAFLKVNGFDEFFHFYGAEDVDLFSRFETAGYREEKTEGLYFFHNWHRSFQGSEDEIVTRNPRIKNIMRINQEHYFRNKDLGLIKPRRQEGMGEVIGVERSSRLKEPTCNYIIPNIAARVEHFLEEELLTLKEEVIKAEFVIDPYYETLKYRLKKKLGKQTQPYLSMKEVNDLVLKKILFNYRDANYSFKIAKDLKSIDFRIEL
ncbi:glycosyltransferase [Gramella sp. MT6]|uniref:glycosyltransferase family 2 protein n=1 Tax=Gramella sp. MT6 TaxID=2705471 RepID=UPI001C5FF308|nr:glycosyltransferase [Gramella sp. MT6]QYA24016.1 glycosyltransferase [Gramella sp. MT6]